jgi:uncharacterized phage protein (TIGR01671 family)
MSRIIKFRAKRKLNGRWAYGSYVHNGNDWCHIIPIGTELEDWEMDRYRVITDTVGQFTGQTDKNGMQIYEGDIVMVEYGRGQVVFSAGCFMIQWIDDPEANMEELGYYRKTGHSREDVDVIGNIHDNPELLKP